MPRAFWSPLQTPASSYETLNMASTKEAHFLAPILLESPLMFEILEKIRDK